LIDSAKAPFLLCRDIAKKVLRPLPSVARETPKSEENTIWALKDISFEVKQGEVVGIIGRNGAGKSTLLKVLSRITEPTEGRVELRGRIGSLLEVGTGFHPELSGHENVYLYGAILGMDRWEVTRKFDEIITFAELEKFVDTPVKRYSSGMYMRLAFAVAAHLEPEILLVDEVLAVGDAAFQKKCLGKMGDVSQEGRTVLFVSHNMSAIQRLCNSAILLDQGKLNATGTPQVVTEKYLQETTSTKMRWDKPSEDDKDVFIKSVSLANHSLEPIHYVTTASDLAVVIRFVVRGQHHDLQLSVGLLDAGGEVIFGSSPQDAGLEPPDDEAEYNAVMFFPPEILLPKTYGIRVVLWHPHSGVLDSVNGIRFSVQEASSLATSTPGGRAGLLSFRCNWVMDRISK
jgi:lipopolysaccharide transport system ATP-binding protein